MTQLKQLKNQIAKDKETLKAVYKYIKAQLSDLDFYTWLDQKQEQKRVMNNLDMSWTQYDELHAQIKDLQRQYKIAKQYKLMR